ncbi:unnamed protein product [Mytilus edulis]|uniref:Uncharacterized protein n=1 Tax=Mytilus edulis TaxID=6550 RepID=A0A8S3R021_MYTED|nr:unnamed protein product [Mytilus edulis]
MSSNDRFKLIFDIKAGKDVQSSAIDKFAEDYLAVYLSAGQQSDSRDRLQLCIILKSKPDVKQKRWKRKISSLKGCTTRKARQSYGTDAIEVTTDVSTTALEKLQNDFLDTHINLSADQCKHITLSTVQQSQSGLWHSEQIRNIISVVEEYIVLMFSRNNKNSALIAVAGNVDYWPYIRYYKHHKTCQGWIPEEELHSILKMTFKEKLKPPVVVPEGRRSVFMYLKVEKDFLRFVLAEDGVEIDQDYVSFSLRFSHGANLRFETNDAPQIPSLTCNFPEPAKDIPPSSFPTTQGIIDDLTRTIEPLTQDVVIQTTESFITTCTVIGDDCKICGEGQLDQRAIWVGCSSKSPCSYWVHARLNHQNVNLLGIITSSQEAKVKAKSRRPKVKLAFSEKKNGKIAELEVSNLNEKLNESIDKLDSSENKLSKCKLNLKRTKAREQYSSSKVKILESQMVPRETEISCCQEKDNIIFELKKSLKEKDKTICELKINCDYLEGVVQDIDKAQRTLTVFDVKSRKYTTILKQCIYELLQHNVSAAKVNPVIKSVLSLVNVQPNALPAKSTILDMNLQRLCLSQKHLAEVFSAEKNTTLLTDETSKFGNKFMGFEASDSKGNLWVLGLRDIETKSAEDTLKVLKEILQDLNEISDSVDNSVSKDILKHISATLSDRAATEVK